MSLTDNDMILAGCTSLQIETYKLRHEDPENQRTLVQVAEIQQCSHQAVTKRLKKVAEKLEKARMTPEKGSELAHPAGDTPATTSRALRDVPIRQMLKQWSSLADDALDAITQEKIDDASARDLAVMAGIATDKSLLLRGMPTQRISIEETRKLDVVISAVFTEARRRGVEIDVSPDGNVVAKPNPYQGGKRHENKMKKIENPDPVEALTT